MHQILKKWIKKIGYQCICTKYEAIDMFPDKIGHLKIP
jgi:hypothetical protein